MSYGITNSLTGVWFSGSFLRYPENLVYDCFVNCLSISTPEGQKCENIKNNFNVVPVDRTNNLLFLRQNLQQTATRVIYSRYCKHIPP